MNGRAGRYWDIPWRKTCWFSGKQLKQVGDGGVKGKRESSGLWGNSDYGWEHEGNNKLGRRRLVLFLREEEKKKEKR